MLSYHLLLLPQFDASFLKIHFQTRPRGFRDRAVFQLQFHFTMQSSQTKLMTLAALTDGTWHFLPIQSLQERRPVARRLSQLR